MTTFTVTYNGNGNTSGIPPSSVAYDLGATVTVLGPGSLSKKGDTFAYWSTVADEAFPGLGYSPGATFAISSNMTLYAQWYPTFVHTVTGSNALSTAFLSCSDDTAAIQKVINENPQGGTLILINVVCKTRLDLSSWAGTGIGVVDNKDVVVSGGGTGSVIQLSGICRYAINAGELDVPSGIVIDGSLGGGGNSTLIGEAGNFSLFGTNGVSRWVGYNSKGERAYEPRNYSDAASVVSYGYMYTVILATGYWWPAAPIVPPVDLLDHTLLGQTLSTFGASDSTYNGSWTLIASYTNIAGQSVARLLWNGSPTAARPNIAKITFQWSVGTYKGSGFDITDSIEGKTVMKVTGLSNVPPDCWKHWMSLTNCTPAASYLNNKIHRIMGTDGSGTACFLIAQVVSLVHKVPLPEYGIGGGAGNGKVNAYESWPSIRCAGNNVSVRSLYLGYLAGPGVVFDSSDWPYQYGFIDNVSFSPLQPPAQATPNTPPPNAGTGMSIIIDAFRFVYIRDFYTSTSASQVCPASVLLTTTHSPNEQITEFVRIRNGQISGSLCFLSLNETTFATMGISNVTIEDVSVEGSIYLPGQNWNAFYVFDGVNLGGNIALSYLNLFDSGSVTRPQYLFESLMPGNNVGYASVTFLSLFAYGIDTHGNAIDNQALTSVGWDAATGPNISPSAILESSNVSQIGNPNYFHSSYNGLLDSSPIGVGDDFSPVITLPYAVTMPELTSLDAWKCLPGTAMISTTDDKGNPLLGPDWTFGKVFRLHCAIRSDYKTLTTWYQEGTAVGDVLLFFCRVRVPVGSAIPYGNGSRVVFTNTNVIFNYNTTSDDSGLLWAPVDPSIGRAAGQWYDIVQSATVTATDTLSCTFSLSLGFGGPDLIIDPESLATCYIPFAENIPSADVIRVARKLRRQVTNAVVGDVAIPGRTGLSFGNLARVFVNDEALSLSVDGVTQISVSESNVTLPQIINASFVSTDGSGNVTYNDAGFLTSLNTAYATYYTVPADKASVTCSEEGHFYSLTWDRLGPNNAVTASASRGIKAINGGVYHVAAGVSVCGPSSAHNLIMSLFKNDVRQIECTARADGIGLNFTNISFSGIIMFNAGDVVDVRVQCIDAGNIVFDIAWGQFSINSITINPNLQPAPTFTSINIDFASANGGESRTMTGTNLRYAGVTQKLTVDSSPATIIAQTATSSTFIVPPSSVSRTDGNNKVSMVTFTTAGGTCSTTGKAGNSLWYLPNYLVKNAALWSAQNVILSQNHISAIPDMSGNGYSAIPISSASAYSTTGGGSGGNLPYYETAPTLTLGATYPNYALITAVEWVIACRPNPSGNQYLASFYHSSANPTYAVFAMENHHIYQYSGTAVNPVVFTPGSDVFVLSYIENGSPTSQQILNGETPVGGSPPTPSDPTPPDPGSDPITAGSVYPNGTYPNTSCPARTYLTALYPAALSTAARANWSAYLLNQGIG